MTEIRGWGAIASVMGCIAACPANAAVFGSATVVEKISPLAEVTVNGGGAPVFSSPIATVTRSNGGPDAYFAQAFSSSSGSAEVRVENTNESGIAFSGGTDDQTIRAAAEYFASYTNVGETQVFGVFSYTIADITLRANNYGGIAPKAEVSHEFEVLFGASPSSFSAEVELTGNYNDFQITSASGFESPTVEREECVFDTCYSGVARVASLTKSYSLGIIDPGETVNLYYALAVKTTFTGTEVGAIAFASDPGSPVFTATELGSPPTVVPVPASGLLLASVFGVGLFLQRRR